MKTLAEAQDAIKTLAGEFQVETPFVRLNNRRKRCAYVQRRRTIELSERYGSWYWLDSGDHTFSVIHEFAHHLNHHEQGFPGMKLHHDSSFLSCLVRVAQAWYGNPLLYPYGREYRRLRPRYPVYCARVGAHNVEP